MALTVDQILRLLKHSQPECTIEFRTNDHNDEPLYYELEGVEVRYALKDGALEQTAIILVGKP